MRRIWPILRGLFGFAEKVHTALWLIELVGVSAMIGFLVAGIRLYVSQHTNWFVVAGGFIVSFAIFSLPRPLYRLFRRWKAREPVYTIRFDYIPGNMLDNGWVRAYPANTDVKPKATLASDAPVAGSIVIDAPDGHAYDHRVPRNVRLSDRLVFAAKYTTGTMIFTQVELSSKDGTQTEYKWIKYEPGKGPPHPTKGYDEHECTFPIMGKPLQNGWRNFEISLPDVVAQTWAKRGLIFKGVTVFRLRARLGISPIQFYESR